MKSRSPAPPLRTGRHAAHPPAALHPSLHRRGRYAIVVDWLATATDVRVGVSDQTESHYKQIGKLEPEWGRALDDLGVTYAQLRWVAGACGADHLAQRQARYGALVAFLRGGGRGERAFLALAKRFPKVGRAAARERNERARAEAEAAEAARPRKRRG